MTGFDTSAVYALLGAVQVLGLASAWLTRLSERSRRQAPCQCLFLACLALVAGSTIVALGLGSGCWLVCGTTFSLMVLAVTCDFSRSREAVLG
jgi:hypothetical protein